MQAKDVLARHTATTVRWDECLEVIHARRPGCVLEIGPGQALARMWNDRYPEVAARSCDEFRSAASVVRWVTDSASANA
jgi:[acyl-carrier-protein] S-malonyltransferase